MYLQASHKFIKFTFAMSLRLTIDVQIKKLINRKLYYSQVHIILETILILSLKHGSCAIFINPQEIWNKIIYLKHQITFFVIKNPVDCANSSFGAFFHTRAWVTEKIPFMQLPAKFMDNFLSFIVPYTILSTFRVFL